MWKNNGKHIVLTKSYEIIKVSSVSFLTEHRKLFTMSKKWTVLILYIYIVLLAGCQNVKSPINDTRTKSSVTHIVLLWLKKPGAEINRQKIINTSKNLRLIPELKSISIGKVLTSKRKIVDSSFDIGIVMKFDNKKSMQKYLVHPLHKQMVKQVIMPATKKIVVYDIIH